MSTQKLTVSSSVEMILNDDGGMLMDTHRGILFSLNPTGSEIWRLLSGGADRESLIDSLASTTQMAPAVLNEDVDSFLNDLAQHHLIEVAGRRP
jgi:hypothetical protein